MRHYEIVNAGYGSEGNLVPGKLSNEKDPKSYPKSKINLGLTKV